MEREREIELEAVRGKPNENFIASDYYHDNFMFMCDKRNKREYIKM